MKELIGTRTRRKILTAGMELWPCVTLTGVANELGMTRQAVSYHYPGGTLKGAVEEFAVLCDDSPIILQLIAQGHEMVADMSPEERRRHFEAI